MTQTSQIQNSDIFIKLSIFIHGKKGEVELGVKTKKKSIQRISKKLVKPMFFGYPGYSEWGYVCGGECKS